MENFESLLFYIVLFIISALMITKVGSWYRKGEYKDNKTKIIILTTIGLGIPIIIAALRYEVGSDYESYINIYQNRMNYTLVEALTNNWEILFSIVVKIANLLNDYQFMFAIISFLSVIILYATIYNYKEKLSLGFMFFLYLFLYFTTSFNIVRQTLAVVIVAYSYKFIINRQLKKFIVTVLIASLFHTTALFFLPFYLVFDKNKTKRKIVKCIYLIITLLIVFNYSFIINLLSKVSTFEKFELYSTEIDSNNLDFILNVIIVSIILLFRKLLIKYDSRNELFIYFSIINVILLMTGYFSPFVKRIALYFGISNIFLFASLPQISKNDGQKALIYFLIAIYAVAIFTITVYVLKQGNVIPYQTIFTR